MLRSRSRIGTCLSGLIGFAAIFAGMAIASGESTTQPATSLGVNPMHTAISSEIANLPPAPTTPKSVEDLKIIQRRVEAVVREALPATVAILLEDAQGSGVIISPDGYILTAGHVSGKPNQTVMIVLSGGRRVRAKTLGANHSIDSGILKIIDPGDYPYVPIGTAKTLTAGQWVVALGHPGGLQSGRPPVVRLGRVLLDYSKMIGTDCPLINGDSGGPLFDLDGRLVGINSRIGETTTTNIHVPIDTYVATWDRLAKGDEWGGVSGLFARRDDGPNDSGVVLGVNVKEAQGGAVISRVRAGTPAEKAGLHEGDIIQKFEGIVVKGGDDLAAAVQKKKPGDAVKIDILRDQKPMIISVTLTALR